MPTDALICRSVAPPRTRATHPPLPPTEGPAHTTRAAKAPPWWIGGTRVLVGTAKRDNVKAYQRHLKTKLKCKE